MTGLLWRDAIRLSVGTFSRIRVEPPSQITPRIAARAMLLAPVLALGPAALVLVGAAGAAAVGWGALVSAAVLVALVGWFSRGLHLDGLADTADGLAASYQPERTLAVMRRPEIGAAGAATLILVLLVQISASAQLFSRGWAGSILVAWALVMSRALLPLACSGTQPADSAGLGAMVARSVPRWQAWGLFAGLTGISMAIGAAAAGCPWWLPGIASAVAVLGFRMLMRRAIQRVGGITGDILGALVELGFALFLLVYVAA